MSGSSDAPRGGDASRRRDALTWIALVVAAAALGVIVWACVTAWGAIVHGHPAYAVLLGAAALLAVLGVVVALRAQPLQRGDGAPAHSPRRIALVGG